MRGRGMEDKLRLVKLPKKNCKNDGESILADLIVECFPQLKIDIGPQAESTLQMPRKITLSFHQNP